MVGGLVIFCWFLFSKKGANCLLPLLSSLAVILSGPLIGCLLHFLSNQIRTHVNAKTQDIISDTPYDLPNETTLFAFAQFEVLTQ